jgi:hypothetical protein
MKLLLGSVLVAALVAAPVARAARKADVIVYSRVTAAGRKRPAPTVDHPAYCVLVQGGYREVGMTVRGEHSPPAPVVERLVGRALVAEGYRAATTRSPRIDMFIVYHWGCINPVVVSTFEEGRVDPRNPNAQPPLIEHRQILNDQQMLGLLGVAALDDKHFATDAQVQAIAQAAEDDRYFVVLSAYDWTAITHQQRVLLWRAMMSLPTLGTDLDESLPALVTAGAPYFGRETGLPQHVTEPLVPPGKVEIGPTRMEGFLPAAGAAPPSGAPPKNR